jgi:quercetin dioxygenase-like cupin family protein
MEAQAHLVKLSRRTVMLSGLVGVSALVLGKSGGALAQPGVEPKVIKETPSRIAGVPKVQLVEVTLQPGAVMPTSKMDSAMICECTRGALEVTLDENKKATMNTGDIWTCGVGTMEGVANQGTSVAIMRVFILLT